MPFVNIRIVKDVIADDPVAKKTAMAEKIAAATMRLCPCGGISPSETPSAARMKENSPICDRLAPTVSAVVSG